MGYGLAAVVEYNGGRTWGENGLLIGLAAVLSSGLAATWQTGGGTRRVQGGFSFSSTSAVRLIFSWIQAASSTDRHRYRGYSQLITTDVRRRDGWQYAGSALGLILEQ